MEDAVLDSDALIEAYEAGISNFDGLHTTCISLYEFLRGLAYLKKDVAQYMGYVESHLEVLPLDNAAIGEASRIYGELRRQGALVEEPDMLIASMCIVNKLPLVTGNVKHFERFSRYGLVINPMKAFINSVKSEGPKT